MSGPPLHIALVEPRIGPNTGNILRRPDFPANWMFEVQCAVLLTAADH